MATTGSVIFSCLLSRAIGRVGVAAGALVVDVVDLQEPDVVGGRC